MFAYHDFGVHTLQSESMFVCCLQISTGISSGKAATFGIGAIQVNMNNQIHILTYINMQ